MLLHSLILQGLIGEHLLLTTQLVLGNGLRCFLRKCSAPVERRERHLLQNELNPCGDGNGNQCSQEPE